jgi:hypothetical protein
MAREGRDDRARIKSMTDNIAAQRDAFRMLIGKWLGGGISRQVYECALFPEYVVKVEDEAGRFQNIVEWETWSRVEHTEHAKWFSPCRWISPNGIVLIMQRTRELGDSDFPSRMPAFLGDFKRENYGRIGRRIVCHDYGTHLMLETGMTLRTRRVTWR